MATKQEIDKAISDIRGALDLLQSAVDAIAEAQDVFRDSAALIDAMSDELAEWRREA